VQPADVALDLALIVMQSGGSTTMADRTFTNVLTGCRKEGVSAVWRLDFVAVSSSAAGESSTILRPVGAVGMHLIRASAARALSEQVANGQVHADSLTSEVHRIKNLPSPYGRGTLMLAAAWAAACFSRTAGGDWGAFGLTFVAAGLGQSVRPWLQARDLTRVSATLVCALISGLIATSGLRFGVSHVVAATVMASVIYMIPGVLLITGFLDIVFVVDHAPCDVLLLYADENRDP